MQYRCYLEECSKLSQNPDDRRNHCITEHEFPKDFRFDCYNQTKKSNNKVDGKKRQQKCVDPSKMALQPSKMVSVTTHDEDIELEDKSILLTAQRKHFTNFSFGHKKTKSFQSNQSYAKQLTAKSQIPNTKPKTGLDNVNLVDELMESLPQ